MTDSDEGEQERALLGIDGTMGDAQDLDHPYVESVHGDYCVVCGLAKPYKRHTEVTSNDGRESTDDR